MTRRDLGDVIGYFGIGPADDTPVPGERSFRCLLGRFDWNQGYMTEALRGVLAYEFGTSAASGLRATCNIANAASARVMEKAGMLREQTALDVNDTGNYVWQHHYAITKAEYDAQREQGVR